MTPPRPVPCPPPAGDPARAAGGDAAALAAAIAACRACADDFAATATAHAPRPVVWFSAGARVLIAGQAPGARVHAAGRPFADASGERLRRWLGLDAARFYDRASIAIVPMAFCFPGYDAKGADLPPPPRCAALWRRAVLAALPGLRLTILVGGHAIRWHTGHRGSVTAAVAGWRGLAPAVFPLPHPSWRTRAWAARNPWLEAELLPALRRRLAEVLAGG